MGNDVAVAHVILLGDSIFDNATYAVGAPDVVRQVRQRLPQGSKATLAAVDGGKIGGVPSHGGYPGRGAIKSHGYAGVPQKIQKMLSQFRVTAAPQKQGGTRVPEVVPANIAKPCALQQGLKCRLTTFRAGTVEPIVRNTRPLSRQLERLAAILNHGAL